MTGKDRFILSLPCLKPLHTEYYLCYLFSNVKQTEAVYSLACVNLGVEVRIT